MSQYRHHQRWTRKTVNIKSLGTNDEIHDAAGSLIGFRHAVADGTYPKCGLDHPLIGISDYIKFDKHIDGRYTVTGIRIERDSDKTGWDWIIELKEVKA
ncbi:MULTISPECIES: hypothetical protein [unclassified Psychrobacter]|uniref:hypothetical protein n=1 Tax=unclassified Psychrobacter TaxID=196806 RepID=UPI0018F5A928|nr:MULTISPECIES: hypothetical protein [unclassified Psychrobacter]